MQGSESPSATKQQLFPRYSRQRLVEALGDTRIVLLLGARQVGKSTLARGIAAKEHRAHVADLDDRVTRAAAQGDPTGFVAGLERPALIDEVQRGGPDLLLAIKEVVDRDPKPGSFLLTGSANLMASRRAYDALTGRVELVRLWPLSQSEVEGTEANLVDALFTRRAPRIVDSPVGRDAYAARLVEGGYPEARARQARRRRAWFASYLETTLERDLRDIGDAHKLEAMPRLLRMLAARTTGTLVYRNVAADLGIHHETVKAYTQLLQAIFLVRLIPAWRPGLSAREIQAPKAQLVDSGLLMHLLGADQDRLGSDDRVTGGALESFVAMELLKQADWAAIDTTLHHYRRADAEVDLVLESRAGDIACVEVKAAASLRAKDWREMAKLRDARDDSFRAGFVIYTGAQTVPLGDRLWAVSITALWSG